MALVERLMGLNAAGTAEDHNNKIPVHAFFAAQSEVVRGALTVAQVKNFLNMDAATQTEYDAIVALAPTGGTTAAQIGKLNFINQMHAVFMLAEKRYPGYSTPAEVRTKLGI